MNTPPIDLSRLPAPDIVEPLSYETLLAERKAKLVSLYPAEQQADIAATLELESEPLTILLQESAYRELVLRQRVNDAARAVMLAYARGANLDHLAALFGIERLTLVKADPPNNLEAVHESDADLRKRTQLAPQGYSVAGPEGAYVSHTLNADARVLDVSVTSPAPCEVLVTILSREPGGKASDDLIQTVSAALQADNVRPLTDQVTVRPAEVVFYTVEAAIDTCAGPDSGIVLKQARARLDRYIQATHRLGRDITLSGLYAALHVEGVARVQLNSPLIDLPITRTQAPYCISATVEHRGSA